MLSRDRPTTWWLQTSSAVFAAASAVGLTSLLSLHDHPFLLPMVAVVVTTLRGGVTAGLASGLSSLALTNYVLVPPAWAFTVPTPQDAYGLAAVTATAALISMHAGHRRDAQLTLQATLASIGDGVIVTDTDTRVRFLNVVAEHLTGWTNESAAGQPIARVFTVINEASRRPLTAPLQRALEEGVVVGLGTHALLVSRDGTERPVADTAAPIRDRHGRTVGAVLVFSDITAQRAVEEALKRQASERQELLDREREARGEAERANRLKDEFLATLSHELRTPLNAVLGWSHMLTRRELSPAQQKQALAAIHRNAHAQARLVDDVLDLSRIVTGRMALAAETVNLSEIVRTSADSFTPAVLGKRQDLRLDLGPDAEVTGDPHRLRQIIWNLLSNATKFTPEGGVISCRVAALAGYVELTVSDTGQGIEPGFLPYIFDRFRQGDSSTTRGYGGLGLGLALVRHLVEAHGGTVYATSGGTGNGATIIVRLPARLAKIQDLRPEKLEVSAWPRREAAALEAVHFRAAGGRGKEDHANAL